MQIVESSFLGLRAAIYKFRHSDLEAKIILVPMIHIGEPDFFRRVKEEISGCDFFIIEGVRASSKKFSFGKLLFKSLTSVYTIPVKRKKLGLVLQKNYLKFNDLKGKTLSGDVTLEAFLEEWKKEPFFFRLFRFFLSPLLGSYFYFFGTRKQIASVAAMDDLPSRKEILGWSETSEKLDSTVKKFRDAHLLKVIKKHLKANPKSKTAIIFGAGHTIPIKNLLDQELGFKVDKAEWITVFTY